MSDWRGSGLLLGENGPDAKCDPACTVKIRLAEGRYCVVSCKTARPDAV